MPHVHVHVIPRIPNVKDNDKDDVGPTDEVYHKMAGEEGNVGGALWDVSRTEKSRKNSHHPYQHRHHPQELSGLEDGPRPEPGGVLDKIDDALRMPRSPAEMKKEVDEYKKQLASMGY